MAKRVWKVEWASRPCADGEQRLAQAVGEMIEQGKCPRARKPRRTAAAREAIREVREVGAEQREVDA